MGQRMKNYGLAAGPRSTMHLSVSEECKNPAYTAQRRKNRGTFVSSWGSTEIAPCFQQSFAVISFLCLLQSHSLKTLWAMRNANKTERRGRKNCFFSGQKLNNSGNKLRSEGTEKYINIFSSLLWFFSLFSFSSEWLVCECNYRKSCC